MKSREDQSRRSAMGRSRIQTIFYSAAALISLVGLAEATYLTVVFLSGETAVCGGSADCLQVLGSSYAKIGGVSVRGFRAPPFFNAFAFATFFGFGYRPTREFFASPG